MTPATATIEALNRAWFDRCRAMGITPPLDEHGEPTETPPAKAEERSVAA